MPLPPPPDVALSSTGKPSSTAAILISARLATPSVPGTSGTPAARISAFARALSPVFSITSAGGPMKTRSLSVQARTKAGFSERKPKPGWTASQPVVSAAATTLGIRR